MQRIVKLLSRVTVCLALCWPFPALAQGLDLLNLAAMDGVLQDLGIKNNSPEAAALRKLLQAQQADSVQLRRKDQKEGKTVIPLGLDPALQAKYRPELQKLLTPEQFARLLQIHWHLSGRNAVLDDDFAKLLGLSQEQREQLLAARTDYETSYRSQITRPKTPGTDPVEEIQKNHQKSLELRKKWDQRINEILSKEQQEKSVTLKGKPFTLKLQGNRRPSAEIIISTRGLIGLALLEPVLNELGIAMDAPEVAELRKLLKARGGELSQQLQLFTPEERTSSNYAKLAVDIEEKYNAELQKILKPAQYSRVSQIRFQSWGAKALRRPDIIKTLDLSVGQRERLGDLESSILIKVRNVRGSDDAQRGPEDAGVDAELKELKLEHDRKIQDILTPEQQVKFAELKGKPFDLTSLEPQD